jgi:hypothetical protein
MRRHIPLAATALALLCVAWAAGARAHGIGKPQVLNAASGPYLISVWTDPDPLRVDEAHVVVAVTEPETRQPIITGVEVMVRMQSIDDPSLHISQIADADETNQLLFAAEFNEQVSAGRWRVGVSAAGERGAGEEVSFEVDVSPARSFNWLWLGIGGLAVAVLGWMIYTMRTPSPTARSRRASVPPADPSH